MTSINEAVNLQTQLSLISTYWVPQHLFTLDSSHSLKLAKIRGDFIWHSHLNTDEMFYVVAGGPLHMDMATSASKHESGGWKTVTLSQGDVFNVPQGVRHRPRADVETGILMIRKSRNFQYW
jgi:mannose-6-phosphate isomerase-like protein (cupin superfamily)